MLINFCVFFPRTQTIEQKMMDLRQYNVGKEVAGWRLVNEVAKMKW